MLAQSNISTLNFVLVLVVAIGCSDAQTTGSANSSDTELKFDESIEAAERVNQWEREKAETELFETQFERQQDSEEAEARSPDKSSH